MYYYFNRYGRSKFGLFPFSLLLVVILLGCARADGDAVLNELHFQSDIGQDATSAVLEVILSVGQNSVSRIKFEKGTYHFFPNKALEEYRYMSNHNDEVVRTAFPLKEFSNLIIDGQGAEFIFHGRMIPFIIDNCQDIEIVNLTIDWAMPFHSEALIVANNLEEGTFDLQIPEKYPYEIRNNQLIFVKEFYEHGLGQAILYDPDRKAVAYDTESYTPLTLFSKTAVQRNIDDISYKYEIDPRDSFHAAIGREDKLIARELKPGLVRIYNHKKEIPPVGKVLVCKGMQSKNRLAPAIHLTNTSDFGIKNVTVYHAGGMGLIAENCEDLTLDNFNVTPSYGRMVSTTADATHFVGCRGQVILKNCTFNNQLDDASNVHGTYQKVVDVLDENTIGVRMGHYQQQGFTIGRTNDTIGLVRLSESFFPYHKLTIKSIKRLNGRYQIVSFNEQLPESLSKGDLIENLDAYPELLVENCNIGRNRARGLLISTPKKTVIRNNFFNTEMEAILVPVESSHWYESGSVTDLTIQDNVFNDCNHSGYDRGVIRFVTDDDNENIAFQNVEIVDNEFEHFDNLILEISNTKGLLFKGNEISNSGTFSPLFFNNPAIIVNASDDILFENNKYSGKAEEILQVDGSLPNLKFN